MNPSKTLPLLSLLGLFGLAGALTAGGNAVYVHSEPAHFAGAELVEDWDTGCQPSCADIDPLLRNLTDCSPKVRAKAARMLGSLDSGVYPCIDCALARALIYDCDKHVRLAAVKALKKLGSCEPCVREALDYATKDECLHVRLIACLALKHCLKNYRSCPPCDRGCEAAPCDLTPSCPSGCHSATSAHVAADGGILLCGGVVELAPEVIVESAPVVVADETCQCPRCRAARRPSFWKKLLRPLEEAPRHAQPFWTDTHRFEPHIRDVRYLPHSSTVPGGETGQVETLPLIPRNVRGYYVLPRVR